MSRSTSAPSILAEQLYTGAHVCPDSLLGLSLPRLARSVRDTVQEGVSCARTCEGTPTYLQKFLGGRPRGSSAGC